jgi:hypothetical protein
MPSCYQPIASLERGVVGSRGLNLAPELPPPGRLRHRFGDGPFARLLMPPLSDVPGLYLTQEEDRVVYVGQTRMPLHHWLGSKRLRDD